jgi:serpin B
MLDAGAAGETDAELRSALHFTLPGERAHEAYGALLGSLAVGRGFGAYTLATANRLFGQQGFEFLPGFLATTKDHYGAELMPVDFAGDAEGARGAVNEWVRGETDGKIGELFEPGSLDGTTRLVLANAILFKGKWDDRFDDTRDRPFRIADGTQVTVPLMTKQDAIAIARIPGGRLGVMPFRGKDLSMLVLLPDEPSGLPAIEQQLSAASLAEWIGRARADGRRAAVALPRFRLEAALDLKEVLEALGVVTAFDPSRADFSAMNGRRDLHLQKTVHKAVIAVDEEGAEAAAATGAGAGVVSVPQSFEVDRPFVLMIYDHVTGAVLFMGRVMDPRVTEAGDGA